MVSPSRPPRAAVSASIDFTQTDPRLSKQGNSYAQLVVELQGVQTWRKPKVELEQYPTPPDIAAHMLFAADAQGDLADSLVADLGCGGAILGIGAVLADPWHTPVSI